MLGCEFEVHEPPKLLAYLRALGARATRAAQAPTGASRGDTGALPYPTVSYSSERGG